MTTAYVQGLMVKILITKRPFLHKNIPSFLVRSYHRELFHCVQEAGLIGGLAIAILGPTSQGSMTCAFVTTWDTLENL